MEYVKLGRTGLDVSRICLGCMSYGAPDRGNHAWSIDEADARPFIKRALEGGSKLPSQPRQFAFTSALRIECWVEPPRAELIE